MLLAALDSQDDSSRGSDDGVNNNNNNNAGAISNNSNNGAIGSSNGGGVFDKDFKGVIPEAERSAEWDGREMSLFRTLLPVFPGQLVRM